MNVVFRLPSEELDAKFVAEASKAGMVGLKGHRSVGGIRASIYNAVPVEGVEKLADFMQQIPARPTAELRQGARRVRAQGDDSLANSAPGPEFSKGRYSREHTWSFDGGVTVPASSSPSVVRQPYSNPAAVDPEEAFVASIASCHMLTFVYLAGRRGFEVTSYEDDAVGHMTKNERGVPWVSSVVLHPRVVYAGTAPTPHEEEQLHEESHLECYISQSVKTDIRVER